MPVLSTGSRGRGRSVAPAGANIIQAVDNVRAELPRLIASLPGDIDLTFAVDRSKTIRQSLLDTEKTLVIAVLLVILVVFAFLRNVRAAFIPSVAVPTSIIGSFGVMYPSGSASTTCRSWR